MIPAVIAGLVAMTIGAMMLMGLFVVGTYYWRKRCMIAEARIPRRGDRGRFVRRGA